MSELIQKNDNRATIRWKLLTGTSALAMMAYVSAVNPSKAEDADRPLVWVELGGGMDLLEGFSSPVVAPFMLKTPTPDPYYGGIFINGQKPPRFAFGFDGAISFQPEDSSWIFAADIRYGRAHGKKHIHHQTLPTFPSRTRYVGNVIASYADISSASKENHAIMDFGAGRDVGLGLLGHNGQSIVNLGVRFAQFSSGGNVTAYARPTIIPYFYGFGFLFPGYNAYSMHAQVAHKFHGVGPSISWSASAALAGTRQDGELTLDWSVNGALLFGRQRTKLNHTTHAIYIPGSYYHHYNVQSRYNLPHPVDRSRSVTVPNIGGTVGVSVRYPNVKFSLGYRYDTFLNAMDTGIDARKTSNLTFQGPYASISVGIGD